MRLLGAVSSRRADFEETHHSAVLKEPLKTKGTLTFIAPSTVEKHVLEPFEERYRADDDMLVVEKHEEGRSRTLLLEDYPALEAFVEGFRAVLAGDAESLRQRYDVRLEGDQDIWILILTPLDDSVRELVQVLRFEGKGDALTFVRIREPNGDHSTMVITRHAQ